MGGDHVMRLEIVDHGAATTCSVFTTTTTTTLPQQP